MMVDELGEWILLNCITSVFSNFPQKHDLRKIRVHDLRHTCASLLLNKGKQNGITLKEIQVWLGHSNFFHNGKYLFALGRKFQNFIP